MKKTWRLLKLWYYEKRLGYLRQVLALKDTEISQGVIESQMSDVQDQINKILIDDINANSLKS